MKVFGKTHARTAVTEWIERMTSEKYQDDDLADVFQLCEVINLQDSGPKEANKALRRVFKYGNTHSQLCGLTILESLAENCDTKFQEQISTVKFTELLRTMANSPNTDPKVRRRLMLLLAKWSNEFKDQSSMHIIAHLYDSVSNNKVAVSSSSRRGSTSRSVSQGSSSPTSSKEKRKGAEKSSSKNSQKNIQLSSYTSEKVNEEIGMAIQNATNLINAITLKSSYTDIESDTELQGFVRKCKVSSEQLIKIIPTVTDGSQLGPLLQSNDQIQNALEIYSDFCNSISQASQMDEITSGIKNVGLRNKKDDKIHKDFVDLINFDSSSLQPSANSNITYENNLLDDPFADPFTDPVTPSMTPEPKTVNKPKRRLEWAEI